MRQRYSLSPAQLRRRLRPYHAGEIPPGHILWQQHSRGYQAGIGLLALSALVALVGGGSGVVSCASTGHCGRMLWFVPLAGPALGAYATALEPNCAGDRHGCTFLVIGGVVLSAVQLIGAAFFFRGLRQRRYFLDVHDMTPTGL